MDNTVIKFNVTDDAISKMKAKSSGLKVTNNTERKDVTSHIKQTKDLRVKIEGRRKELKADALEFGRQVDAEAKRITALLLEVENPLKDMRNEFDAEKQRIKDEKARIEAERVAKIQQKIDVIKNKPSDVVGKNSSEIEEAIEFIQSHEPKEEFFNEFFDEVEEALKTSLAKLQEMFASASSQEQEAIRLAEERKAFEAQQATAEAERKEAEAKLSEERRVLAEKQSKVDAEQKALKEEKERVAQKTAVKKTKKEEPPVQEEQEKPTYEELLEALEGLMSLHDPNGKFQPSHWKPFLAKAKDLIKRARA